MKSIPKSQYWDITLPLLQKGYPLLMQQFEKIQSPVIRSRIMLEPVICLHGKEAAELFYSTELFKRAGTAPKRVQTTLFGEGGVQALDDEAHLNRKSMFMQLMSREHLEELMKLQAEYWDLYIRKWQTVSSVRLFDEAQELLCRAVCKWSGIPLKEGEVKARSKTLGYMIDAFGGFGPRHQKGKVARKVAEKWIKSIVRQIRNGELLPDKDTTAYKFSWHKDTEGKLLDEQIVAVEILNILRPTVAIATYISFAALALHQHPELRKKLNEEQENYTEYFAQEVRRFYPFTPLLGARARRPFAWNDYYFKRNQLVLLDVYGMLHDDIIWEDAGTFRPERFANHQDSPYTFIPQGGGDFMANHRCAGEWLTIESLKVALDALSRKIRYSLPEQDLHYPLDRMPTRPQSGIMMEHIRLQQQKAGSADTNRPDRPPMSCPYDHQTTAKQVNAQDPSVVR